MNITVVIKIIGVVLVLLGVLYTARPEIIKKMIAFFTKGKRIYIAGLIRLVLAIVFLIASGQSRIPAVIITLGILFLLGAFLIFVLGPVRIRPMLEWWQKQSILLLRILSVITILIGALAIYAA